MNRLTQRPEEVTKKLLSVLPKRTRDVVEMRFGLNKNAKRHTLESIGVKYDITRERVRQIEADALSRIRKSPVMNELSDVFAELEKSFQEAGGVVRETVALSSFSHRSSDENHIAFLLALQDKTMFRVHEDGSLHSRWTCEKTSDVTAQKVLSHAVGELKKINEPIPEAQLYEILSASSEAVLGSRVPHMALASWLGISKIVARNHFGEWGLTDLPTIKPRGVRDLSFLVMSKARKPMHFSEVASAIGTMIGKKAHIQTVHNELIKDGRFVLVGRGLYALREWGYEEGTVRDIITKILKEQGSLPKDRVISLVTERRMVKPNTIMVNLDNRRHFKKLSDGTYTLFRS